MVSFVKVPGVFSSAARIIGEWLQTEMRRGF
jgi:hypothetical protein